MSETMAAQTPEVVLRGFITAMNRWERESWAASKAARNTDNPASYWTLVIEHMNAIFAQFCTRRERPYGRQGSFRHPPEYDPDTEQILEVVEESARRVHIITQQQTGFKTKCRYVLLKQQGQWRIDNRHILLPDGNTIPNTL
jgi:hypothetical protein